MYNCLIPPIRIYYRDKVELGMVDCTYPGIIPNRYGITIDGRVYSYRFKKFLKPAVDKDGYLRVTLFKTDGSPRPIGIHRLVAWEFIHNPFPNEYTVVNHIDIIKSNNHYTNLHWCTVHYNNLYTQLNGDYPWGEYSHLNKYSEALVREICELFQKGYTIKEVLAMYNCGSTFNTNMYSFIRGIYCKRTWYHITKEYIW